MTRNRNRKSFLPMPGTHIATVLAVTIALALAGCGSGQSGGGSVSNGQASTGFSTTAEEAWPAQEALKELTVDGITGIAYSTYTEGGVQAGAINDAEQIEEAYLRLCNVRLGEASTAGVEDDGLRVEVLTSGESLVFQFEGDILVIDKDTRYEVEQLDPVKGFFNRLLEDAALSETSGSYSSESAATEGEDAAVATDGKKIFASGVMDFSFLYDEAHTGYITTAGAAELAINGDESLVGLYVAAVDAKDMPEVSQIIEEGMFNETQKYLNAIAQPPAENAITIDGHELQGYVFSYSTRQGGTVDATYYVEARNGRYIFYTTEVYRDAEDYWAAQEAMEQAVRTLELSYEAYGESAAVVGDIGTDNTPEQSEAPAESAAQGSGQTGGQSAAASDVFAGDYTFDIDPDKYLVLSDGQLTMVYTGGGMEMPVFQVQEETGNIPLDDIGNYVVDAKNSTMADLQNRLTDEPEVVAFSIDDRRIVGIEYAYSSEDGTRTIEARFYLEPIGDRIFGWYALWNRGDEVTPELLNTAINTFALH